MWSKYRPYIAKVRRIESPQADRENAYSAIVAAHETLRLATEPALAMEAV